VRRVSHDKIGGSNALTDLASDESLSGTLGNIHRTFDSKHSLIHIMKIRSTTIYRNFS